MAHALYSRQLHLLTRIQRLGRLATVIGFGDDLIDLKLLTHLGQLARTVTDDFVLTPFGTDYLRRALEEGREG